MVPHIFGANSVAFFTLEAVIELVSEFDGKLELPKCFWEKPHHR